MSKEDLKPNIRPMGREEVPKVVEGWNEAFPFDKVDEEKFARTVFGDLNYERAGTLIAEDEGQIIGFASCVTREGVSGRDGKGTEKEKDYGYLKGIFYEDEDIGKALLKRIEEFLRSRRKSVIKAVRYGGGTYFFPGIDLRYERLLRFLKQNDFEETGQLQDVSLELEKYQPGQGEYQRKQWERVKDEGIEIVSYRPQMLPRMREFVPGLNIRSWFGRGWEKDWEKRGNTVVAVKGKRILGYASFRPASEGREAGGFGSIGTLPSERGKGIGTCMMDECMRKLKETGTKVVIARWANTPFYLKSGWEVCREYAVLEKRIP